MYRIGPGGRRVLVDPRTGRPLAYTGADVVTSFLTGTAMLLVGLALVLLASRRRRRDEPGRG